jgi:hypothetical protein
VHRISTDAGMQIDFSFEQLEHANDSIRLSSDSGSNDNDKIRSLIEKHPCPKISTSLRTVGFRSAPKYQMIVTHSKFIRKSPEILKF